MGLLETLRPDATNGWQQLDADEQQLLLTCARRAGHLPTLRTLAEMRTLTGPARDTLIGEREPSIRKKILARHDLTDAEMTTLIAGETRASVLVAIAGSFPDDRIETLLTIAENSRGTSLTEALLRNRRLSEPHQLRMLRDLASRKEYSKLTPGVAEKVANILPADPALLVWLIADNRHGSRWSTSRVLARLAHQVATADAAIELIDAMAAAEHVEHPTGFIRNLLDGDNLVSARHQLTLPEAAKLANELNRRVGTTTGSWPKLSGPVGTLLTQLGPLLAKLGQPAVLDVEAGDSDDVSWETLNSGEIAAQLTSGRRLDALSVARLACNPNHTDPTAAKTAQLTTQTPGAALAVIERFEQTADSVWRHIVSGGSGENVAARHAIEHLGADRLAQVLANPSYRGVDPQTYRYWRRSWPLLGGGPLSWLLTGDPHPQAAQVALALPVKETYPGDEALAFRLLAGQVGDDPAAWDVVDGLIGQWDGTYAQLIAVARQINT
jgi:hypothetical protein